MLGGSFNPIHIGHLILAEEVVHRLGYHKIIFVPVNIPPHKHLAEGANNGQRLEMVQLAIHDNKNFDVDCCELERGGISYTYDTLHILLEKYKDIIEGNIGVIFGDDLVAGFETWGHYKELPNLADIILARRILPASNTKINFPYKYRELANSLFPLSSSEVREKIKNPSLGSWRYLVPKEIYQYIIDRNLYGYRSN